MTRPTLALPLVLVTWSTFLCAPCLAHAAGVTALGDLPGGMFYSFATAVSADGGAVAGYSTSSDGQQAFRWTQATGMVGLGYLPGAISKSSTATGVSADGTVVVGYGKSTNPGPTTEAFRWTQASGIVRLGYLPGGSTGSSSARAVSVDGAVVVGYSSSSNGTQAFRWTQATGMVGLGYLPGATLSSATCLSTDGSVVAGYCTSPATPFRWAEVGGMVGLAPPISSTVNKAYAISADGSVVVGQWQAPTTWEAFRWTENGGMAGLGVAWSQANGVSADGRVVVGFGTSTNAAGAEAHVWTLPGGARTLYEILNASGEDLSHWRYLTEAKAVSADGRYVAGYGVNTNGDTEAFLADIGPRIFLSVSVLTNGSLKLLWSTVTNQVWVDFTPSMPATQWANLAGPLTGTNCLSVAPTNLPTGFYRVRTE